LKGKLKVSGTQGGNYVKFNKDNFRGEENPLKVVTMLTGRSVFVRKSEQTVNIAVVIPIIIGVIAIPWGYMKILDWSYKISTDKQRTMLLYTTTTPDASTDNGLITFLNDRIFTPQPTQVIKVQVQVNYPTTMPTITDTPDKSEVFYYTYYNPNLLAVGDLDQDGNCGHQEGSWCHVINCWDYSIKQSKCVSLTASGQAYTDWWNRGLACPMKYPLWTVFIVTSPPALAGRWTCIDRGGSVDGSRLDFLQLNQVVPWASEVRAIVEYPKP
jgi:hypothetical protein